MILFSVPIFFPLFAAAASSDEQRRFEIVFPHNRECFDSPGFRDDYGDGCDWYNSDHRCANSEEWASGPHRSAQKHCCKCGGGDIHAHGISYKYVPAGCVSGDNIVKYGDKSVAECALLCEEDLSCMAFEFGVDYGATGGHYKPRDCQLQYSANLAGCGGKGWNLDLYVKQGTIGSVCAVEGEECKCSGTVHYGRRYYEGKAGDEISFIEMIHAYSTKTKALGAGGKVECTNDAMGDPEKGEPKWCFCELDYVKEAMAERYEFVSRGCVSGFNLVLHKDKSVDECAALCDQNSDCLAFEYGAEYKEGGAYEARDCQLQSSADYEHHHCDGAEHNLDLYIKPVIPLPDTFPNACEDSWNLCFHNGDCRGIIMDSFDAGAFPRCGDNAKCTGLFGCFLNNQDLNVEWAPQKPERCLGLYRSCALDSVCVEAIHQMERPLDEVTCTPGDSKCSALLQCYNRAERPGPQIGAKARMSPSCGMGLHSIVDEDDCRLAAGALGLTYGGTYDYHHDRPGCMYMENDVKELNDFKRKPAQKVNLKRDTIYFNTGAFGFGLCGDPSSRAWCSSKGNAVCVAPERSFVKLSFKTRKQTCHKDQLLRKECHEGKPCTYDECSKLCDWNNSCTHFAISSTGICKTFTSCDDVDETGTDWETYAYAHPTPETAKCSTRLGMDVKAGTFEHHPDSNQSGITSDYECRELCRAAAGCTAWVRQPSTNKCWLSEQWTPNIEFETESDRNSGLMCYDREPYVVEVGSSSSNDAHVEVPVGVVCPSKVSKNNWLGGHTHPDIFDVVMEPAGKTKQALTVSRVDHPSGWGMNLRFECSWATGDMSPVKCANEGEECMCDGTVYYMKRYHDVCVGCQSQGEVDFDSMADFRHMMQHFSHKTKQVAVPGVNSKIQCSDDVMGGVPYTHGKAKQCFCEPHSQRRLADGGKTQNRLLKLGKLRKLAELHAPAPVRK